MAMESFSPALTVLKWEDAQKIFHAENHRERLPITRKHLSMFIENRHIGGFKGRQWRAHRNILRRFFDTHAVIKYRTTVEEVSQTLIKSIKRAHRMSCSDSVVLEISKLSKMVTMDVLDLAGKQQTRF